LVREEAPFARWLPSYGEAARISPEDLGIFARMLGAGRDHIFAHSLDQEGQTLAWGLGSVREKRASFAAVVVRTGVRGQGWGRRLMEGLLAEAKSRGAREACLQVRDGNLAARKLYRSLGFLPEYGYWYRAQGTTTPTWNPQRKSG